MTLEVKLNDFRGQSHCFWKSVFLACFSGRRRVRSSMLRLGYAIRRVLQNKEGVNNNKDVFFFGCSVGNNYLCKDFSAKAIKDTFQHSVA